MAKLWTVKDIVSQASMEIGIAQRGISTAVGSLDQDIAQMVALLSAVADEVLLDEPYRDTLGDEVWIYDENGNPQGRHHLRHRPHRLRQPPLPSTALKYRFLKAKGLGIWRGNAGLHQPPQQARQPRQRHRARPLRRRGPRPMRMMPSRYLKPEPAKVKRGGIAQRQAPQCAAERPAPVVQADRGRSAHRADPRQFRHRGRPDQMPGRLPDCSTPTPTPPSRSGR